MHKKIIRKAKTRILRKLSYYSQIGQDRIVLKILKNKKDGFFIDIGANDGVTFSNTKYMEELGWNGICVEPNPDMFEKLEKARRCSCVNSAIGSKNKQAKFTKINGDACMLSGLSEFLTNNDKERIKNETTNRSGQIEEINVNVITFDELLNDSNITKVDYISIDTEGSEFEILKNINFSKYDISVLTVENNYNDNERREYMRKQGYRIIKCLWDDIYIKKK